MENKPCFNFGRCLSTADQVCLKWTASNAFERYKSIDHLADCSYLDDDVAHILVCALSRSQQSRVMAARVKWKEKLAGGMGRGCDGRRGCAGGGVDAHADRTRRRCVTSNASRAEPNQAAVFDPLVLTFPSLITFHSSFFSTCLPGRVAPLFPLFTSKVQYSTTPWMAEGQARARGDLSTRLHLSRRESSLLLRPTMHSRTGRRRATRRARRAMPANEQSWPR